MKKTLNILFIGCGNMGEPILQAFLSQSKAENIFIQEKKERSEELSKKYGIQIFSENSPSIDLVALAIKPQQLNDIDFSVFLFHENTLLISILAGMPSKKLEEKTSLKKIIRIMPNLPLLYGEGMSTFFVQNVNKEEKNFIQNIFSSTGKMIELQNEEKMHEATLLAGSGPGLYFYFCELFENLAKEYGFSEEESAVLAKQTFIGSASLLKNSKESAKTWKERVTSKGGTTEAALECLKKLQLQETFKQAVDSGIQRSKDLSK